jgi:oxygen-independent coproporphyrinogen-3 oxidase
MRLGIYIQVPFCQTKCTYCNFHTGVYSAASYAPYAAAVAREIAEHPRLRQHWSIADAPESIVDTIYIGGGTPSLLDTSDLGGMIAAVQASFPCELQEVTLEADPETITPERAAAWRAAGINRISMGTQSFQDRELQAAGRMHRRADIFQAERLLRAAGFSNLSFDLIAGLPYQNHESWEESLQRLLELRPEHISIYLLEIDEGSRLGLEILNQGARYSAAAVPSDDEMAAFYEAAGTEFSRAGYNHYEISNWAVPGRESRHNRKYWSRQPYLGFGAGAHSFNLAQRWANAHDPAGYVSAIEAGRFPVEQLETVSPDMALAEELFLGLRQLQGIDLDRIAAQYPDQYSAEMRGRVDRLEELGLLKREGPRLRLAEDRLSVSNEVFVALV